MKRALSLLLSAALLLLTACAARPATPTPSPPEDSPAGDGLPALTRPPELRVSCGEGEVTAEKTTYSWSYRDADGSMKHVEADGLHPLQMLDEAGRISLTPLPVPEGDAVKLTFGIAPEEVSVRCWPEEMAYAWFADHGQFAAAVEQAEELTMAEGRVTPPGEGGFIYEVTAKWSDEAGCGGTAYYGFHTTGGDGPDAPEGDPELAFLEEVSRYTPEDWSGLEAGEFKDLYARLQQAAVGTDQAQRNIRVITAFLRSDGAYAELLSRILWAQREADAEAWTEALAAFSREEASSVWMAADSAGETKVSADRFVPYYPGEVKAEEITAFSLRGLTEEDLAEGDSLTDGDWEKVRAFLRHLSPVKVPITGEEWNAVFFSGYLRMDFTVSDRSYSIRADEPAAVYVFCDTLEGEEIYIGEFRSEAEEFRSVAELLYPPEEPFRFTRENFPRLNGSTSTVPLAEAVCSILLGESREEVGDLIHFSKTTQAYRELLYGHADLLIIGEANADILAEKEAKGFEWLKTPFATDAFVFVVNEKNPVDSITVEEARRIYTGEIANWSELGGEDIPIIPFQRNAEAGSQTLMEKHVMQGTPMMDAPTDYIIASMGGLMEAVKSYDNSAGAIGYSVYYYAEEMKAAQGLKLLKLEGVEPNPETIRSGEYPIVNPKYVVISAEAAEDSPTRRLYDWLLSQEGQRLIAAEGYVSILDIPPEEREISVVGRHWDGEWDGLAPLEDPEPVTAYAGARLRDTWPSTTGCLYGFMTPEGRALTPPVYSSIQRLTWYDPVNGENRRLQPWVLRQGSGEPWPSGNAYTLAAADLSWIWPGTWQKVIPGPDFFLLLGADHMEQVSEKGERLGSWDYAEYGLEEYVPLLMSGYYDGYEGSVTGGGLAVHVDYTEHTDPKLTLFRFADGSLETVGLNELIQESGVRVENRLWNVEKTGTGCRLSRGEETVELPVPALESTAYFWGDLVIYESGARIFRRDGSEVLPPEETEGRRSVGSMGGVLGWMEPGDLLCLALYGEDTETWRFIRADGSILALRTEKPLWQEDPLTVTLDGNLLGIVERKQASYYRVDTEECVFRIPLPFEAD